MTRRDFTCEYLALGS